MSKAVPLSQTQVHVIIIRNDLNIGTASIMPTIIIGNINIDPLLKAQQFLGKGIQQAQSKLEKAGAVLAFGFCYELAWKTMKRILQYRGIEVASPREVFRFAAQDKLIKDPENWFEFITKRNLTSHVYNTEVAEMIFRFLPLFADELAQFISTICIF